MTANVSILIEAVRDGETSSVFVADAKLSRLKNNDFRISFTEIDQPQTKAKTSFTLSHDLKSLTVCSQSQKYIGTSGCFELRTGSRQQIHYISDSSMTVGITTGSVRSTLTDDGGAIEVRYTLDFNSAYAISNIFRISVRRKRMRNMRKKKDINERTNI